MMIYVGQLYRCEFYAGHREAEQVVLFRSASVSVHKKYGELMYLHTCV